MEVKVSCPCGSRFAFDVEPVDGQMPVSLNCPSCNADVTCLANENIAQQLAPPPQTAAPAGESSFAVKAAPAEPSFGLKVKGHSSAAPSAPAAPASAPQASAPAPETPKPLGLTIGGRSAAQLASGHKPAPAPAAAQEESSSGGSSTGLGFKPSTSSSEGSTHVPKPAGFKSAAPPDIDANFKKGVAGAVVGAMIGGGILFGFLKGTGIAGGIVCGLVTMIVGVLAGFGAKLLGKQFNTNLGVIAGACTVVAILSARFAFAWGEVQDFKKGMTEGSAMPTYEEMVAEAKEGLALKTDDEIKAFLRKREEADFKRFADPGEKLEPMQLTAEDVQDFKETDIPEFQAIVDGKPSKEEYEKQVAENAKSTEEISNHWLTNVWLIFRTLGIIQIFWLCTSTSTAWKIGSNTDAG